MAWWYSDPAQRYWMEITHRPDEDIGTNLWSPNRGDVPADHLASLVRKGDRVLHWKAWEAGREQSLVGWSEVIKAPRIAVCDYWGDGKEVETWFTVLGGLKRFKRPITSASLLPLLDQLMDVRDELVETYGKPIYFPFIRYRRSELRAWQGYLAKFPVELFDVIPGIESARLKGAHGLKGRRS